MEKEFRANIYGHNHDKYSKFYQERFYFTYKPFLDTMKKLIEDEKVSKFLEMRKNKEEMLK